MTAVVPLMVLYCLVRYILLDFNSQSDNLSQSPHLTLTYEIVSLLSIQNGAELSAVLFHGGSNNGSAITLKGTDGGRLYFDLEYFGQLMMHPSREDVRPHYSCS